MSRTEFNGDQILDGTLMDADIASNAAIAVSKINGAVPNTRQVNGHALSADISITKSDVNLGSVPNIDCTNAGNISSGTLADARLGANVTVQGNTFNGISQLVQLNASTQYPALDGSLITGLTKTQVGLSAVPNTDCTNASNISSGTLNALRLPSSVTLQGNTFNGISQLVQLNASTQLPAVSGALLTNLTKTQVGLSSVENTALSTWVGTTNITTLGTIGTGTWNATAIALSKGGTGLTSYTLGDLLYGDASNALSKLAGNTTTTKKVLVQTGNGTISAAPAWEPISTAVGTGLTKVLVINAGTQGITGGTDVQVLFPTETLDTNSEFATNAFTSKSVQTVLVSCILTISTGITSNHSMYVKIFKNNNLLYQTSSKSEDSSACAHISMPVEVVVGDTIKIYCRHSDGSSSRNLDGTQVLSIKTLV